MKKIIVYITLAILVAACAPSSRHSGEVTGVGGTAWNEPTPYGMVLISRGSYKMGPAEKDSIWGTQQEPRAVSIDAFWMDETEITNSKYKQFVFWVRDSIIRERLADPAYGGNEVFKIEEDREGNPIKPRLNWDKAIPWRNPNEDEARAIESVYRINPITGERQLDASQMNYRYEIFDHTEASKRKNRLDPARRDLNTDHTPDYDEIVMISKDTAYIDEDGRIIRETITRPLGSEFDFLNTYIVNIYPDTTVWVNDFENAYNEPYVRLYFSHAGYNDYPVVGVSWEQANAFCAWRTVRDVFLFCCFTSLRYSDVRNLKRSDVKSDHIEVTTVKTADSLSIELNKYSKAILEKYKDIHFENHMALPVISNQKMNDYLKELGELAEINEPIRETYYKGNERIDEVTPKYALLSTHAGRRTFICNALALGIPAQVVMKWTGHSDYKAMKPYIDIADDIKANAMNKFNQL